MAELKPCPFCGGEAEIKIGGLEFHRSTGKNNILSIQTTARVKCKKCYFEHTSWEIRIPIDERKIELQSTLAEETRHIVEKWNRRVDNG